VLAAAAAAVVIVMIGGAYVLLGGGGGGAGVASGGNHGGGTPAVAPKIPGCTTAVASAKTLNKITSSSLNLGGNPFAVTSTPDGRFSFVTHGNSLAVLSNGTALAPTVVHTLSVPGASKGEAITKDGKYLLLAAGSGAQVVNVLDAEQGSAVVAGTLASPNGRGAVQVQLSRDDRFAFVTLQSSGGVAVFNLHQALASNFTQPSFVGIIPTGDEPVGIAASPDGKWLYVTSMRKVNAVNPSEGFVSVVNLRKAEKKPAKSVVSQVTAGCSPVRVITSKDGSVVWVTARESNALLGFSAAKMPKDPGHSLIARVDVGEGPIGLTFVAHGKRIVVADSNLKNVQGASPFLSLVSTAKALAHQPALLGQIKTGTLPRQFTAEGKTLLVTNYGSGQLQAINIADLP
jgi:DNA-binding beta-propeller fold protein YncE